MQSEFKRKWQAAVSLKNSLLCVGIDPAEPGQRDKNTLSETTSKLDFCLEVIDKVAPYAAAIKPNRQYLRDLSREEMKVMTARIHDQSLASSCTATGKGMKPKCC